MTLVYEPQRKVGGSPSAEHQIRPMPHNCAGTLQQEALQEPQRPPPALKQIMRKWRAPARCTGARWAAPWACMEKKVAGAVVLVNCAM